MALIEELRRRPLTYAAAVEASSRSTVARLRDAGVITIADHLRDAKGVALVPGDGESRTVLAFGSISTTNRQKNPAPRTPSRLRQ